VSGLWNDDEDLDFLFEDSPAAPPPLPAGSTHQYVAGKLEFDGQTYDPAVDFTRLKNNTVRVLLRLLDGAKHGKPSLEPVGGAAYDSRIRDLRKARFGGFLIYEERDPATDNTMSRYWLDMASVTDEKVRAILHWTIPDDPSNEDKRLRGLRIAIRKAIPRLDEAGCRSVLEHIGKLGSATRLPTAEEIMADEALLDEDDG